MHRRPKSWWQANQQVNVLFRAIDGQGFAFEFPCEATKVGVEFGLQEQSVGRDPWC
jgi:hypothetical protein